MKQLCIRADSFVLTKRRIRIYRIRQRGTGTVLWTMPEAAIHYLKELQIQRLRRRKKT